MRNVAIIAHVDHGKTTLVDGLLRSSGMNYQEDRLMDSGELEREKGITIESKVTSIKYQDHMINIVDTPGHQDFGGEVERVLTMVDGVILVVCATEGIMKQTRYVAKKAMALGLKPVLVINKVDRETARIDEVEEEILELMFDLSVEEDLSEYKTFYSSAKMFASFETLDEVEAFVKRNVGKTGEDLMVDPTSDMGMSKILDYLIGNISVPNLLGNSEDPVKMLISQIDHDKIFGRIIRGKISSGTLLVGDSLNAYNFKKKLVEKGKISKIFKSNGVSRSEMEQAKAGDIVGITGFGKAGITDTLTNMKGSFCISGPEIDQPTVCVEVLPNNSPLSGQNSEAKMGFTEIKNRLLYEAERDLAMKVQVEGSTKVLLFGRGDLHIGVILEKMRREGFEMMVSCPKITMRMEKGVKVEPIEHLTIECDLKHVSLALDLLMGRKADVTDQQATGEGDRQIIYAEIPARGLLGFKMIMESETNNSVNIQHSFLRWEPHKGTIDKKSKNLLIASHDGSTTAYSINNLEKFGLFFVKPGMKVYEGQIIGLSNDKEMVINPCKAKHLTNIRAAGNDENIRLAGIKVFSIEEAISFISDDDYIEVTKDFLRLRKKELNADVRKDKKKRKTMENDLIID